MLTSFILQHSPQRHTNLSQNQQVNFKQQLDRSKEIMALKKDFSSQLGSYSKRVRSLSKLYSEVFKKAHADYYINAKHIYNHRYPITKIDILKSFEAYNKDYIGIDAKYRISIDSSVEKKVDDFINNSNQDLPIKINTPIKYLMQDPIIMGDNKNLILLSAQQEGGYDFFCGNEVICTSVLITLKKDNKGIYNEVNSVTPDPSGGFNTTLEKLDNYTVKGTTYFSTYSGNGGKTYATIKLNDNGELTLKHT